MSIFGKIAAGLFVSFLVVALLFGVWIAWKFPSLNNGALAYEKSIDAKELVAQNALSTHVQTILEMAQVPAMMADQLKEVFSGANEARYGKDGSAATMQWIKEQNPNLDPSIYQQLSQTIKIGREDYETVQNLLIDECRSYEYYTKSFPNVLFFAFLPYPNEGYKMGTGKCRMITNKYTKDVYEKGYEDGPVKIH